MNSRLLLWPSFVIEASKLQGSFSSIEVVVRRRGFGYLESQVRINLPVLITARIATIDFDGAIKSSLTRPEVPIP
jgi:hypothetical protein